MTEPTAEQRKAASGRDRGEVRRQYHVADVEVRKPEDGATTAAFYGHASVTGTGYEMYGGAEKGGWTEYVDPGAFKRTLGRKPDVAFLVNHEGIALARTTVKDGPGSLKLAEDDIGLEVRASLDTRVSVASDLVTLMDIGVIDEMSFAFRVTDQTWLNDQGDEVPWWDMAGIERHIRAVDIDKGDVSAVNYGANPFTDAGLRALMRNATIVGERGPELVLPYMTYTNGTTTVFANFAGNAVQEIEARDPEVVPVHPDLAERMLAARKRENAWRADPARPL